MAEDKPSVAAKPAGAPPSAPTAGEPERKAYLTADYSEEFGPQGHFVDLTDAEFKAAREGLLQVPTAEQLARRRV